MFVVTLLTQLALGQVAGMAQRWCAIPEPYTSVDIVGGHDVVKQGRSAIDVFVLWFQLLEWEEQSVLAPIATSSPPVCAQAGCTQAGAHASCLCPPSDLPTLLRLTTFSFDHVPTRSDGRGLAR